jgi:2-haloacid dehalogenase
MDFERFSVLTFDCYGTLIDWEHGIANALRPVLESHGVRQSDDEILERFGAVESAVQQGEFLSYAEVLRRVMDRIAERLGFQLGPGERDALVASMGRWPAFADVPLALRRLKARYRLVVVSNVDDALFARTAPNLGVEMDDVVTAEQVRSYKPAPAHWERMLERTGAARDEVLHVAQSLFHDIAPAKALGFATVWVNRRAGRSGSGATPPSTIRPDLEVPDLASLVRLVEAGRDRAR